MLSATALMLDGPQARLRSISNISSDHQWTHTVRTKGRMRVSVTGPPSVVMNGTTLVGGSLSTNLPHTPFPALTSAAVNENAKKNPNETVIKLQFVSVTCF